MVQNFKILLFKSLNKLIYSKMQFEDSENHIQLK